MKAVVLTFARLPLSMLGCYGNLRVRTPQFDRLAAESLVFDQHFGENFAPGAVAHAWGTGCFQFPTAPESRRGGIELGGALKNAGVTTRLVEEAAKEPFPLPELERREVVEGRDGLDARAEDTPFARLVVSGLDALVELQASGAEHWLVWLHSRGVPSPWLSPREYAMEYLEAEASDTDSPSEIDELLAAAARSDGSDDLQIARAIYAGYVTLLDDWVGQLLDGLESAFAGEPHLFLLTAAAGEALGNRARMPDFSAPLRDEIVHTPLIARLTKGAGGERESGFVQPMDVAATLMDYFGIPAEHHQLDGRSFLPAVRGEEWAGRAAAYFGIGRHTCGVRTSRYCLVRADDPPEQRLYLKPEDVWDVLDVAGQWPQYVAEGSTELDRLLGRAEPGV